MLSKEFHSNLIGANDGDNFKPEFLLDIIEDIKLKPLIKINQKL